MTPKVFLSYSHDSDEHCDWVLKLATRLRANGVDIILDKWLRLGQDVASFIENGLSDSDRILCVCSKSYTGKANGGTDGVGYEKRIMTADLMAGVDSNRVIPIIRNNNHGGDKVPTFLKSLLYVDFEDDHLYENRYEELLRDLLNEPVAPIPHLGDNPFENAKRDANQRFFPGSEKYVSPAPRGRVTFDYSNNNGRYSIGSGHFMFETKWSKSSDYNIQLYNDPDSILTVALAKDTLQIDEIRDARVYDGSSRVRRPKVGQIAILQNTNGFFAAIKVVVIRDDTRGSRFDELTFDYVIQTNRTPSFVPSSSSSF